MNTLFREGAYLCKSKRARKVWLAVCLVLRRARRPCVDGGGGGPRRRGGWHGDGAGASEGNGRPPCPPWEAKLLVNR
uniref:Os05g0480350 protein n=1 Tax=Oryza sativa subsp. japonica TaxID=39947 RepID=A0A0P0WNW5_ORYSJ|nr:hypothetical protein EE612_030217 [Oryza sativa]BAS94570.1 Os05g0480350 [Oryza sativa Japonica Group]